MSEPEQPSADGSPAGADAESGETSLERLRATLGAGSTSFFASGAGSATTVVPSGQAAVPVTSVPASAASAAAAAAGQSRTVISGGPSRATEPEQLHEPVPVEQPVEQSVEQPDQASVPLPAPPPEVVLEKAVPAPYVEPSAPEEAHVPVLPLVARPEPLYATTPTEPTAPVLPSLPTAALPRQQERPRPSEQPEWQPAAARATGRVQPLQVGVARNKVQLRRIDPFSVLKTALVLGICLFIAGMVAVVVFYEVLDHAGVFTSLDSALDGFDPNRTIRNALKPDTFLPVTAVVLGAASVLGVALAVLASMLYNLAATFGGGIRVTLQDPAVRRDR